MRVYRFIFYNVVFASLPLAVTIGFRWLVGKPASLGTYVPELLFIAIMVGVTAVGNIGDERLRVSKRMTFKKIRDILMLFIVLTAILYGAYTIDSLQQADVSLFQERLGLVSAVFVPVLCSVAITSEVLLARMKAGA